MSVVTYEAVLEDGQIKLPAGVQLPNQGKVFIVVPSAEQDSRSARIASPRLVRREDAQAFRMEVSEDPTDARL